MENYIFWSEIGSGFEEPGGKTPAARFLSLCTDVPLTQGGWGGVCIQATLPDIVFRERFVP